jgi:hypothetical protein
MKANEMNWSRSMHEKDEKREQNFCPEMWKEESFGRPRHRWEDNIRMDRREIGCGESVDWIHLVQDRDQWWGLVNMVMNLRVL